MSGRARDWPGCALAFVRELDTADVVGAAGVAGVEFTAVPVARYPGSRFCRAASGAFG
jgi:hypothetical protein